MSWPPGVLVIGYGAILVAIVAASALVGAKRGWVKEMLPAVGELLMVLVLFRPEGAGSLFEFGEKASRFIRVMAASGATLDLERWGELAKEYRASPLLNEGNAGLFFFSIFLAVVALTRVASARLLAEAQPTSKGGFLGPIMGALNGFLIALSLDAFVVPMIRGTLAGGLTVAVDWTLPAGGSLTGDYAVSLLGVFVGGLLLALLLGRRAIPGRGNSGRS